MLIQILTSTVLEYNRKKNEDHVHIFVAKDITKNLTLMCSYR